MALPLHLYKYEPLTTRALQNLKSQIIHFGSPLNFNDPYDCALTPNIKTPTDEDIEAIRHAYLRNGKAHAWRRNNLEALRVVSKKYSRGQKNIPEDSYFPGNIRSRFAIQSP